MSPIRPIRVLVVDDEPYLCDLTKEYLDKLEDMKAETAYSVSKARLALSQGHFDAIVSDYQMPGEDGIQFLKSLRSNGDLLPFILFTGKGREEVVIEALNSGADSYLQKGGRPESQYVELEHRIRAAVQKHRAEEALQENEERYRRISETTTDFVFSCIRLKGGEYSIDWMAGDVDGILEYSIEEMRAMKCWGCLVPSEDASIFQENVADLPPGTSRECVLRIRTKSGKIRWLAVNATHAPLREGTSQDRLFGGCSDISERMRAEAALKESEERYRQLFEMESDSLVLVDKRDGQLLEANRVAERMYGYSRSEMLQMKSTDLSAQPDETEHAMRESATSIPLRYHRKKDGSTFPVEITGTNYEWQGVPVLMCAIRDITERKLAEEAVRESEEHYRAIYNSSPIAIELYDARGSLIHANPACLDLFGIEDVGEIGGFSLFDDPNINEKHKSELRRGNSVRYQGVFDFDKVTMLDLYRTRRNGRIELDVLISPLRGGDGSVIGFLIQIQDITERRNAEMELMSARQKLEEANRLAHIGSWDWTAADDHVVWSEELYRIAGRDPSSPAPTFAEQAHVYSPSSWNRLYAAVQRAMETGEPYDLELELIRPDGSVRNTIAIGGVKRDVMGNVVGLHGILQDRTERQQLLRSLKEAAYARILIEAVLDPLVAIDGEGRITDANAAALRLFDKTRERTIGTDLSAHFEEAKRVKEANAEAFRNGAVRNLSLTLRRHSGMKVDVLCNASTYGDEDGKVIGVIAAIRDISELKRMGEALSIANNKLNLLSSITRHDLRNKLTIVSGELELITAEAGTTNLEASLNNAKKAIGQCYSILDFTKEYEAMGISPPSWQNLHDAVEKATRDLNPKGVRIVNEVPRDLQLISDPLIKKVFYNLMENAVRHGMRVTKITFSVKEVEGNCVILCEDDGIGVRPDQKGSIFNRGFGKNTGFGLFLTREILAITGITITETGKAGEGARFEMLAPPGAWRFTSP